MKVINEVSKETEKEKSRRVDRMVFSFSISIIIFPFIILIIIH